jgi:hypothetical protein
VKSAYYFVLFLVALGGVMAYLSMALTQHLDLDTFVQITFGLVMSGLFAALWRQGLASPSSRSKSAIVSSLVGLGLCAFAVALFIGAYAPPTGRRFLPVLLELLGNWPVALLILLAGITVLWGTYSAVSENEA